MNSYVDRHIFPVPRKNQRVALVVIVSAIDLQFSSHRKCIGMILNYSTGVLDFIIIESYNRCRPGLMMAFLIPCLLWREIA